MTDKIQAARSPRFGFDRNSPLVRFWRWWLGELAALMQQWLGQSGETASTSLLIEINPHHFVLHRRLQGVLTEQGRLELQSGDPASSGIAVQALYSRVRHSGENVALLLSDTQYLARRVELPLAAQENLRQVLGFEMDRLTPFKSEQVYFGFRTLQQDTARNRIAVKLIVAPRPGVDGSIELLARWGIPVRAVYISGPENGDDGNINLMPNGRRAPESSGLGKLNLTLLLLTLVLALAAIVIPIWQKRQASIALIPLVDRAKQQATAIETLRHEQEKLATEFNLMPGKKQEIPPVIVVLDELSSLLPDDTWVQQFNLKGKELQIQGETASSSKLITLIESSRIFHNSNFRSPLTKGSAPNSERYQLVAEVKPLTVAALKPSSAYLAPESESAITVINEDQAQPSAASAVMPSVERAATPSAAPVYSQPPRKANRQQSRTANRQPPRPADRQSNRPADRPQREPGNSRRRRSGSQKSLTPQGTISVTVAPVNAPVEAPVETPAEAPAGETEPNATEP